MQITDFSGDLTGFGLTLVLVGGALALLNVITCIVHIWAGTLYIDKARGAAPGSTRHERERPPGRRAAQS